jgi:membrane associated rhomboid family serine protease
MAKKKIKFTYKVFLDAPVPVFFVVISAIVFLVDFLLTKNNSSLNLTSSPTAAGGALPFVLSQPLSYLRLILYVFGFANPQLLLIDLILIMLLGPSIEERYGSIVIGIMMAVSALFAGVLNACFCKTSLRGASCIIFMLIFLNSFMSLSKKKIPLSFIFVIALYIAREFFEKSSSGLVGILICLAGGLCGSLFAFLTSPKARAEKKASSGGLLNKADKEREAYLEELDSQSPRNKDDDGSTIVGTLKF